mmetsp:Transcript_35715/g.107917  ORF Transcript_35715/g.107917 Transcript_35715/m.107917 type:complete len:369 (-) Transcript_35715:79-1185(-)
MLRCARRGAKLGPPSPAAALWHQSDSRRRAPQAFDQGAAPRRCTRPSPGAAAYVLVDVLNPLAVLPQGHLREALLGRVAALAVLLPRSPEALVLAAVGPREDTEAVLLVGQILSLVLPAARPHVMAEAVDHRVLPLAFEDAPVARHVHAQSTNQVVGPCALEDRTVDPMITPNPVLQASTELALVARALAPCLDAVAFLEVAAPLAPIGGAAVVAIRAETAGHIVYPRPNEYVPIAVGETTLADGAIVAPLALVRGAVGPRLPAETMPGVVLPLANVGGAAQKGVQGAILERRPALHHSELLGVVSEVACGRLAVPSRRGLLIGVRNLVLFVSKHTGGGDAQVGAVVAICTTLIRAILAHAAGAHRTP